MGQYTFTQIEMIKDTIKFVWVRELKINKHQSWKRVLRKPQFFLWKFVISDISGILILPIKVIFAASENFTVWPKFGVWTRIGTHFGII